MEAVGGTPFPSALISGLISGTANQLDTRSSNGIKKYGAILEGGQDLRIPEFRVQNVNKADVIEGVLNWPFELFNLIKKSVSLSLKTVNIFVDIK